MNLTHFPVKRGCAVVLGAALFCFAVFSIQAQDGAPAAVVQAFKDAGLPLLRRRAAPPLDFSARPVSASGGMRRLSDLRGKVVFLNFWASWCGPCRSEMPSMEALYQRLKGRGFEILGVNTGEKEPDISAFMRNNSLSFETVPDLSGEISRKYGVSAIPSTFIIDREGMIISRITGSLDWSSPKIIAAFEALLKE